MSGPLVAVSWGNEPLGGVQTWPSGLHRRHQRREPYDIENPPEIVGEGSEAELATNLFYAAHQECALVHPSNFLLRNRVIVEQNQGFFGGGAWTFAVSYLMRRASARTLLNHSIDFSDKGLVSIFLEIMPPGLIRIES